MKFTEQLPYSQLIPLLSHWFDSPLGQELLQREHEFAEEVLPTLFGYHLLQVGWDHRQRLFTASPVSRKVMLIPQMQLGADARTLIANPTELPVVSNEIDVVILHHALDYADNPHQVLREAARVLRPGGYLLSFSFNPASYWGLCRLVRRRVPPLSGGHLIRQGRLHDWLGLLEMTELKTRSACHHLPLESESWRRRLGAFECFSRRLPINSGAVLMVLARKDVVGMTPLKPEWKQKRLLGMPVAEPKPTARG
ncbi:class I SAM-dependent methyltransferase [Marinobacterium sediminicola]|uniref:Methyltransferase domain-containing protein n=1 Tax=Marinobacterium sediminicola TaxID=518898 RepID=A0ABY1RX56_9GAMM|nr:class I SAM-dependent methyltransferase [Marinobacterium sediminicola]ULG67870.1 class I SAM-dependent methyltransferase [Marinobacterium sediminicola]SMR71428.1 Methyltransferase domain-containing protein [Marinobacterium sediminicola]